MNLRIFFDPLPDSDEPEIYAPNSWIRKLTIYKDDFPDWTEAHIAIIGVHEDRGTLNKNMKTAPDEVRRKLYHLNQGNTNAKIVDLGNLRGGITLEESYARLREVVEILLQHHVLPIIIGGGHDMDVAQFEAYQSLGNMINIVNIDSYIDIHYPSELGENKSHINRILSHEPNLLFHYSHIAYQSFLTDTDTVAMLEKLYFETYRIGVVRENIEDIEPAIRNADMLSFDISAIRRSDAPGNVYAQPFGLTGEEACQLCWYAGMSSKLSSAGFYEYNPKKDVDGQTAAVIATMIWYLIEGVSLRRSDTSVKADLIKYIVSLPQEPHKLVFYKDSRSEKWWLEVTLPENWVRLPSDTLIPCSYEDYLGASKGEIPNRWILAHAKLA